MRPYKVLLADDEKNILEGLRHLLDWPALGCDIVAACTDGRKALNFLKENEVDVVITDIRMPYMDGLALVQNAEEITKAQFIVLSGYSDFSYARQCVSMNVSDYLLKPVDEDELRQAVQKVIAAIQAREATEQGIEALSSEAMRAQTAVRDFAFRDYISSVLPSEEEAQVLLEELDLSFPQKEQMALAIHLPGAFALDTPVTRAHITQEVRKSFPQGADLFEFSSNTYIAVVSPANGKDKQSLTRQLQTLLSKLLAVVNGVYIGAGNPTNEKRYIARSVQQAFAASSGKESNVGGVYPVWEMDPARREIVVIPAELLNQFRSNLNTLDVNRVYKAVDDIFDYFETRQGQSLFALQSNALNLVLAGITQLANNEALIETTDFDDIYSTRFIYTSKKPEHVRSYTKKALYALLEKTDPKQRAQGKRTIELIQDYIQQNLSSDLSLVSIAQRFHLSSNYLSQLFKKETGQLYIHYVTEAKMEKAKDMLQSGTYHVYEVADRLGYKDTRYFSRQFEKHTGKKPADYKKPV